MRRAGDFHFDRGLCLAGAGGDLAERIRWRSSRCSGWRLILAQIAARRGDDLVEQGRRRGDRPRAGRRAFARDRRALVYYCFPPFGGIARNCASHNNIRRVWSALRPWPPTSEMKEISVEILNARHPCRGGKKLGGGLRRSGQGAADDARAADDAGRLLRRLARPDGFRADVQHAGGHGAGGGRRGGVEPIARTRIRRQDAPHARPSAAVGPFAAAHGDAVRRRLRGRRVWFIWRWR